VQYRVIAVYLSGIEVTFGEYNQERTFETYDAAERYLETIKDQNVLPTTYELKIEPIESDDVG